MSEPTRANVKEKIPNYWANTIACTAFVYLAIWLISRLPAQFEVLNPLSDAFEDFELTDLYFSRIKEPSPADTNVVMVNLSTLGTRQIAEVVEAIAAHQPAVLGIDVIFNNPIRDQEGDSLLAAALAKIPNVVLASKADNPNEATGQFDTLLKPVPILANQAYLGYANLITEQKQIGNTARSFAPQTKIRDSVFNFFPVEIARHKYPEETKKFLSRKNEVELINYSRRHSEYYILEPSTLFDIDFDLSLQNKVVLAGYLGQTFGDFSIEDKFFTPLNEKYAGKTVPDMFGVVIHANIISMISEQNYIDEWPESVEFLLGLILVYLNICLFYWVEANLKLWYDLISKSLQFMQTILFAGVTIWVFDEYRLKLDLTVGIAALVLSGDLLEVYTSASQTFLKKPLRLLEKISKKKTSEN